MNISLDELFKELELDKDTKDPDENKTIINKLRRTCEKHLRYIFNPFEWFEAIKEIFRHDTYDLWMIGRNIRLLTQQLTLGYNESDTWNLSFNMAKFILPRLEMFKKIIHGYPPDLTWEQWNENLDKMISSFQMILREDDEDWTPKLDDLTAWKDWQKRKDEGLVLFGKYFNYLWD